MTNITETKSSLPAIASERGIDLATWSALKNSIYPGAKDESVAMAFDYCRARQLDPLLKPVHLVPMSVKNAVTGAYEWRDVVMPGIGLYRIQADRAGNYAGADEPVFGPLITLTFKNNVQLTVPEYCSYTVHKIVGDRVVSYTAKEYWLENYATAGKDTDAPNSMWKRRIYGQIAKCAEAQALRKAWPELGSSPTFEEMEGKESLDVRESVIPGEQKSAIIRDEPTAEDAEVIEDAPGRPTVDVEPFDADAELDAAADAINGAQTLAELTALQGPLGVKFANHPEACSQMLSMYSARGNLIKQAARAAK